MTSTAAYANMQNDLYRVVSNALTGPKKELEQINNLLVEIRDLLAILTKDNDD